MNRKEGEEERDGRRRDHILDCRREGRPEDDDLLDWRTKEAMTTTHARKTRNGENQEEGEEEEIMRKYLWLVGAELDDSK
ncbi:hypothetical protein WR25_23446 [Diploscapter pachys]|uniref:Uncharacterized protein n=1 Tax=Diploscapter pachys TaxID=2018661 RepID=A0A2A2KQ73_9BILA|nr:hypothetical protein WR25_23446 [Diploscapter pachys]